MTNQEKELKEFERELENNNKIFINLDEINV